MTTNDVKERRPMRDFPVARLIPNMLTIMSLCSGLTAIRFGLQDKWQEAVIAIVLSAIFDVLDGRVARMLNIASKFGAELDSLADAISFGVAPGFVIYLWLFQNDASGFGWISVLIFAGCCALRLARFNTMLEDHSAPTWTKSFFTGVPAPAGAGVALMPLLLVLFLGQGAMPSHAVMAVWLIVSGGLMVSRLPTLALKNRRVAPVWIVPIMMLSCLTVAALITNPWLTLCVLDALYIAMLPVGWLSYRRRMAQDS